jgi:hypothetical protein
VFEQAANGVADLLVTQQQQGVEHRSRAGAILFCELRKPIPARYAV